MRAPAAQAASPSLEPPRSHEPRPLSSARPRRPKGLGLTVPGVAGPPGASRPARRARAHGPRPDAWPAVRRPDHRAVATTGHAEVTTQDLRRALGAFATGVTVVTTRGPDLSCGMTANAFSSLSLDPPLVLVCVRSTAHLRYAIDANG